MNRSKENMKKALLLGGLCSIAYWVVYIARNILSAVTPQLVEKHISTNEQLGALSSAFFMMYAVGQLINGILGDRLKEKYMVSTGLFIAGIMNFLMCILLNDQMASVMIYGVMGFALSMVYAPMVRYIAENTDAFYSEKCNLALSFSALFGAPVAGVIAGILSWRDAFLLVGFLLLIVGVSFLRIVSSWEKRNFLTKTKERSKSEAKVKGIKNLMERNILLFTLVSALTGVVRTAVVFWMPAYISQYLGFKADAASLIFSISTMCISVAPIVSAVVYEWIHRDMKKMLLLSFGASMLSFALLLMIKTPFLNILFITFAVLCSACAASMVWVVYCPGFRDVGLVSTVAGYLDFISYIAAAFSNILFGKAVSVIGWEKLIFVWAVLMGIGVVSVLISKENESFKLGG